MNAQLATLSIAGIAIKQDAEGRYCLNDFHKAAGEENRHRPQFWMDGGSTRELIGELEKDGIPAFSILRGRLGGTFVVKELVYAYAMWISAKFHLTVIRAYDGLVQKQAAPVAPPLPHDYLSALQALVVSVEENQRQAVLIERAREAVALVKPAVDFHRAVANSNGLLSFVEAGKALGMSNIKLFRLCREAGFIFYDRNGHNVPYQEYITAGHFRVMVDIVSLADGTERVTSVTKVTGKGMQFLTKKFGPKQTALKLVA